MKYIASLILSFLILSCNNNTLDLEEEYKKKSFDAPTNDVDKQSYAIGLDFAVRLKQDSVEVNYDYLLKGIYDQLNDETTLISKTEFDSIMTSFINRSKSLESERQSKNIQSLAKKTAEAKRILPDFMKKYEETPGFYKDETGILYKIIKKADERLPTIEFTQTVVCHMVTTLSTGEQIDNSYKTNGGQPRLLKLDQLFDGLIEAIVKMRKGDKWTVVIPPNLAFGSTGDGRMIPGHVALVVDIEILDVMGQ